jgi:hypothetical protein
MVLISLLLLTGCRDTEPAQLEDTSVPIAGDSSLVSLDSPRLLRRVSLDLRGVLPSVEELDAVEADPSLVRTYAAEWLEDPRFEERMVSMLATQWHTLIDVMEVEYFDFQLDSIQEYEFERSSGEEPLRLMARIAAEDRSWSEIVTADTTVANELLGEIWPLDYPEGEQGWQEVRWTDGRPAAGVLVSNGLWWRYTTNSFNQNRSRAAAIFRLLVCEDYLSRPVSFGDLDSSSEQDQSEMVLSNPFCLACHSAIEPVAASLFGFWVARQYSAIEMVSYHAEREPMGPEMAGVEPSWFGRPVYGLEDMGQAIARDPRFEQCATETMARAMWKRRPEVSDQDEMNKLHAAFMDADMRIGPLLLAIIDGPIYQAGALTEDAEESLQSEMTLRMLSPDQMASVASDLSGFEWIYNGFEQLRNDSQGFRVMAGGVDGENVTHPQRDPSLTWALVAQRLSQATAEYAADAWQSRPGDEDFRTELAELHWHLLALRPTESELQELEDLWLAVDAIDGSEDAWQATLSALLQDPWFLTY